MPTPRCTRSATPFGDLDVEAAGFISVLAPAMKTNLPMSRRLAADVMTAAHQLSLSIYRKDLPLSKEAIVHSTPNLVLDGPYLDAADERWQNKAYVATRILLIRPPPSRRGHPDDALAVRSRLAHHLTSGQGGTAITRRRHDACHYN
jgi:hypothetical protein